MGNEIDYNKEYNINEIVELLKEMTENTKMSENCFGHMWTLRGEGKNRDYYGLYNSGGVSILSFFKLYELLEMKFQLVDWKEEDEWIDICDLAKLMILLEDEEIWKLRINNKIYDFRENGDTNFNSFTDLILPNYRLENLANTEIKYTINV